MGSKDKKPAACAAPLCIYYIIKKKIESSAAIHSSYLLSLSPPILHQLGFCLRISFVSFIYRIVLLTGSPPPPSLSLSTFVRHVLGDPRGETTPALE